MVILIFSGFDWKYFFFRNVSKNQNCLLKLKFGTSTTLNMHGDFHFYPFLGQMYPFWINLVQKFRTINLS